MNFNFDNMNNPNEQLKQDDLNSEEVTAEEKLETGESSNNGNVKTNTEQEPSLDKAEEIEFKIYKITPSDCEDLRLLQGDGGEGEYWKAINVLKSIVGNDYSFPIDTVLWYKKNENGIVEVELVTVTGIRSIIKVDFNNIKNEEVGVDISESSQSSIEWEESNSIEMTEEELAEIEKVNWKEDEEFNSEKRVRLEEWDNEENKEQKIVEEKTIIEEELEKRVMKENKELIEQKNIKEILKSHDELRSLQNELKEEVKKSIEGRRAVSEGIQNQMNQNVDISQLNIGDRMKVETARSEFLKTTKNVLSVKEIDYLLQIGNEAGDLGDLSKTHEERKIEMEELQKIIKAIEEYKSFMEKFEKLTEEEREEAREEVGKFIKWLEWVKENKEDLFLALAAMGMIAGAAALVMSVGLPADMAIPAFLTAKNAIIAGGALVAAGAGYYIYKKEKIQATVNAAGMAVALPIVGGAMILDSILSSEKINKWMETLCGTSLPSWAQDKKERS